ncbi:sigma-70 family RNA polymerase sigma factor [Lactobacillus delbrueckii subsp. lactis]|uniref:sigma-70 family RNA polymerase sigma factor n=1 Tax=Lactobacillus delbrueckii TaxID=1584 RepID=UPI001E32FCB2|nr:sigma-70 family RNA polymerase sigma factor [Lactobacillus delbrueckii]MCD5531394.1 sigma-70 family RNA polymerase sigma factor [Lactobacillus delbrueckii subsp. lactis]MCS8615763.1 sigma-70 family RNA polymerase sigma factor [Lactobacillus delbrueckii subsp. lactis]
MNDVTVLNIVQPYLYGGKVNISDLESKILPQFSKQQGYEFVNILADHHIEIDYGDRPTDASDATKITESDDNMQAHIAQQGPMLFGSEGNLSKVLNSSDFKKQVENSKIETDYHDNFELIKDSRDQYLTDKEKEDARDQIWLVNKRLVQKVACHYYKTHTIGSMSLEDLIVEGFFGLDKAIDKFDPSLGYEFSTYAVWWIKQRIDRATKDEAYTIRLPVHVQEAMAKLSRLERENLTDDQIIEQMSISKSTLHDLRTNRAVFQNMVSINIKIGSEEDGDTSLEDFLSYSNDFMHDDVEQSPEDLALKVAEAEDISEMLHTKLNTREEEVLRMRFGFNNQDPMTLEEVGKKFGITRERVRQIEEKALKKLKAYEARLEYE